MKVDFESVLFGFAFLLLVIISLPEQSQGKPSAIETAAAEQAQNGADAPLNR